MVFDNQSIRLKFSKLIFTNLLILLIYKYKILINKFKKKI